MVKVIFNRSRADREFIGDACVALANGEKC
jgi:hypothetical protein